MISSFFIKYFKPFYNELIKYSIALVLVNIYDNFNKLYIIQYNTVYYTILYIQEFRNCNI